jgi:hypothetical protein
MKAVEYFEIPRYNKKYFRICSVVNKTSADKKVSFSKYRSYCIKLHRLC